MLDRRTFLSLTAASLASTAAPALAATVPARINFSQQPAAGTLPAHWIHGSPSAMDNTDPPVEVHWYNQHTAILRQNKAYAFEAPFMLLFFGNDRILLIDQGDRSQRADWPLRDVVDDCITTWCRRQNRRPEDLEFLLALSHLHTDHFSAQNQFADRPNTRIMGLSHAEMIGFWGMTHYPEQEVTLDLGGRTVRIWGNPGHTFSEFAYYDTWTHFLFTGDMFYRGRLYITLWQPWLASMRRLVHFCDTAPVSHIAGCHVEMGVGHVDFPAGTTYQPNEAPWTLTPDELRRTLRHAESLNDPAPGVYFTGDVFLCRLDGPFLTPESNPYRYE